MRQMDGVDTKETTTITFSIITAQKGQASSTLEVVLFTCRRIRKQTVSSQYRKLTMQSSLWCSLDGTKLDISEYNRQE